MFFLSDLLYHIYSVIYSRLLLKYVSASNNFIHRSFCLLYSVCLNILESYQPVCRADSAAVAITTTDLVSKSVALESKVCKTCFLFRFALIYTLLWQTNYNQYAYIKLVIVLLFWMGHWYGYWIIGPNGSSSYIACLISNANSVTPRSFDKDNI